MSNIYKLIRESQEININCVNAVQVLDEGVLVLRSGKTFQVTEDEASELEIIIASISLGGDCKECEEQVRILTGQIDTLNDEIEVLEENLEAAKRDKAALQEQVETLTEENKDLEENLEAVNRDKAVLQEQVDALTEEIEDLEEELEVAKRDKAVLLEQINSLRANIQELLFQIELLQNNVEYLETQNAGLLSDIEALRYTLEGYKISLAERENKLQQVYAAVDSIKSHTVSYKDVTIDAGNVVEAINDLQFGGGGKNLETLIDEFEDHPNSILLYPGSDATFTAYPNFASDSSSQVFTVQNDDLGNFKWIELPNLSSFQRVITQGQGTTGYVDANIISINCDWSNLVSFAKTVDYTGGTYPFSYSYLLAVAKVKMDNIKRVRAMFSSCPSLRKVELSNFASDNTYYMFTMSKISEYVKFGENTVLKDPYGLFHSASVHNIINLPTVNGNCGYMFYNTKLGPDTEITLKSSDGVTSLAHAFEITENLRKVTFDSSFDTSNCTNMLSLFDNCRSIETIEGLENLDFSKVTNINRMFCLCDKLESDIILPDLANPATIFDFSQFCKGVKSKNITIGNISGAADFSDMMGNIYIPRTETLIIGDADGATAMNTMCGGNSYIKTIRMGSLNSVVNAHNAFNSCKSLRSLTLKNISSVIYATNMFSQCTALTDLKIDQLPVGSVTLDLSYSPLDIESVRYIAATTGPGACTLKFSTTTKALEGFEDAATILRGKGYTVS